MTAVQLEVVQLVDDFFAGLAHEELCVLNDWSVHLLEGKSPGNLAKMAEERPIRSPSHPLTTIRKPRSRTGRYCSRT